MNLGAVVHDRLELPGMRPKVLASAGYGISDEVQEGLDDLVLIVKHDAIDAEGTRSKNIFRLRKE
jgi:hypothetical protein